MEVRNKNQLKIIRRELRKKSREEAKSQSNRGSRKRRNSRDCLSAIIDLDSSSDRNSKDLFCAMNLHNPIKHMPSGFSRLSKKFSASSAKLKSQTANNNVNGIRTGTVSGSNSENLNKDKVHHDQKTGNHIKNKQILKNKTNDGQANDNKSENQKTLESNDETTSLATSLVYGPKDRDLASVLSEFLNVRRDTVSSLFVF